MTAKYQEKREEISCLQVLVVHLEVLELEASPNNKYFAICGEKKVDFFW
jgi:hypothetical protein